MIQTQSMMVGNLNLSIAISVLWNQSLKNTNKHDASLLGLDIKAWEVSSWEISKETHFFFYCQNAR